MRKYQIRIFIVGIVCLLSVVSVLSQETTRKSTVANRYLISASAGGVNFVSGEVSVNKGDLGSSYLLKGATVKAGEKVRTGSNGRAEILLNPGSYLRLGVNSEFEFVTTSLDSLKIKVNRGSVMFEVYAGGDFIVTVVTPQSRFYLVKSGVYRIDILENGTSKIEVRKGRAQIGTRFATKVKKGRAAEVNGNLVAVSKFKRKDRDQFESWSRFRAKGLAKANAKLKRKTYKSSLWNSYRSNRWNTFDSYGLWTYSSSFGGYCFLPFDRGWRSPYGFGLRRGLSQFGLPRYIYYYRPANTYNGARTNAGVRTSRRVRATSRTGNSSSRRGSRSGVSGARRSSVGRRPQSVRPAPRRRTTTPRRPARTTRFKVNPRNIEN